jgi:16S rRNA (guanine966-N2)-methyltransferase
MRIIAGKYRSRIIKMPKGIKVRPTKDRIREALFNIIGESIFGARVLDAFAGSGAFGIEALSRGAERVIFVDKEKKCIKTIRDNLRTLKIGVNNNIMIWGMDVFKAFANLERKKEKFDVILLDPPYYKDMVKKSLIILNHHDILRPNCIIVAEHYKKDILPREFPNITSCRTSCYGDIFLTFYKAKEVAT